jgi:hypothetical protein
MIANDFDDSALNQATRREDGSDILSVSRAERTVLTVQLSTFVPADDAVDVSTFLEELDAQAATVLQEIDDLERAADLYRRLTRSNRANAQGWLLRGRIEEKPGWVAKARVTECSIARNQSCSCSRPRSLNRR